MSDNNPQRSGQRPNRRQHFFNRAKTAAERSTCLRRKIGAVIISKDGVELSSGYVGSPRDSAHCTELGTCLRIELGIEPGQNYELCRSVHAEQNAIINAARVGVSIVGGEMYISSERIADAYPARQVDRRRIYGPCIICKKMILNAGITKVHMREEGVGDRAYSISTIRDMLAREEEGWRAKRRPVRSVTDAAGARSKASESG
jgi:dCMP deaminase